MNLIISKIGQACSPLTYSLYSLSAKNSIQLIARDVFKLSSFVKLYFPLVENAQPSFSTRGDVLVLVLVFASQIYKVFFL